MKSITQFINESINEAKINIADFINELGITFDFSSNDEFVDEKNMLALLDSCLGKKTIATLQSISIDIMVNDPEDEFSPVSIDYDIKTDANETYEGSVRYTFDGPQDRTKLASSDIPGHKYNDDEWLEDFCLALKNGYFK